MVSSSVLKDRYFVAAEEKLVVTHIHKRTLCGPQQQLRLSNNHETRNPSYCDETRGSYQTTVDAPSSFSVHPGKSNKESSHKMKSANVVTVPLKVKARSSLSKLKGHGLGDDKYVPLLSCPTPSTVASVHHDQRNDDGDEGNGAGNVDTGVSFYANRKQDRSTSYPVGRDGNANMVVETDTIKTAGFADSTRSENNNKSSDTVSKSLTRTVEKGEEEEEGQEVVLETVGQRNSPTGMPKTSTYTIASTQCQVTREERRNPVLQIHGPDKSTTINVSNSQTPHDCRQDDEEQSEDETTRVTNDRGTQAYKSYSQEFSFKISATSQSSQVDNSSCLTEVPRHWVGEDDLSMITQCRTAPSLLGDEDEEEEEEQELDDDFTLGSLSVDRPPPAKRRRQKPSFNKLVDDFTLGSLSVERPLATRRRRQSSLVERIQQSSFEISMDTFSFPHADSQRTDINSDEGNCHFTDNINNEREYQTTKGRAKTFDSNDQFQDSRWMRSLPFDRYSVTGDGCSSPVVNETGHPNFNGSVGASPVGATPVAGVDPAGVDPVRVDYASEFAASSWCGVSLPILLLLRIAQK